METTGRIIAILEERGGIAKSTGKSWKVAQYVLETIENYPKRMVFEVFGEDKITLFNIKEGEELTVSFDVDAREYQGKWYNQIRAWKVERTQNNPQPNTSSSGITNNVSDIPAFSDNDALPFDPPF